MLTKLELTDFKSFRKAELQLGPFTVLVGANATGKSNIRDALRFLHGIGRGYTFADIFGEKYAGGGRVWSGIRGGARFIATYGSKSFALATNLELPPDYPREPPSKVHHHIAVNPGSEKHGPALRHEKLTINSNVFVETADLRAQGPAASVRQDRTPVRLARGPKGEYSGDRSIVREALERDRREESNAMYGGDVEAVRQRPPTFHVFTHCNALLDQYSDTAFFDFDPDAMRQPSFPGQLLGDRGENFSSALLDLCSNERSKQVLLQWVRALTPMDVHDFEFVPDQIGRILVTLVEKDGRKTSAYSASDGTLRFLGLAAALLGPEPAKLYFIEELENGIHPTRLHLLIQLIEQQTQARDIQVVATTHSPTLLAMLSPESLEHASLCYRLPDQPDTRIRRIVDIPDAKRLIEKGKLSHLHESGWLERTVYYTDETSSEEISKDTAA